VTGHHYRVLAQNKINNVLVAAFRKKNWDSFHPKRQLSFFLPSKAEKAVLGTASQLHPTMEEVGTTLNHCAKTNETEKKSKAN
jgi:hypothetical protein